MGVNEILLDTNAYAAFKRNEPNAVEIIRYVPLIGVSCVVLGEILGGFIAGTREKENRTELNSFIASSRVKLITINERTAEQYAAVYKGLRLKGEPIPTNDMWIAACALQHNLAVFSYDRHFCAIEGLRVGQQLLDFII